VLTIACHVEVLFVVDATDQARLAMAKKHLHEIVQEQALHAVPVSLTRRSQKSLLLSG